MAPGNPLKLLGRTYIYFVYILLCAVTSVCNTRGLSLLLGACGPCALACVPRKLNLGCRAHILCPSLILHAYVTAPS